MWSWQCSAECLAALAWRECDNSLRRRRRAQSRQYRGVRAEQLERAVLEECQLVESRHERRAVSHHDHSDATLLELDERIDECDLACRIEIRIRLIEHDQPRVTVQRA